MTLKFFASTIEHPRRFCPEAKEARVFKPSLQPVVRKFAPIRTVLVTAIFFFGVVFGAMLASIPGTAPSVDVRITVSQPALSGYVVDAYDGNESLVCRPYDDSFDRLGPPETIKIVPGGYGLGYAPFDYCPPGSMHIVWNNEPSCEPRLIRLSRIVW